MRVTVLGGSGYTGAAAVQEAVSRGHDVVSISRSVPDAAVDGATYVAADASAEGTLDRAVDADVVIATLSPRGPLAGAVEPLYLRLAAKAVTAGTRLVVVGGYSGLRQAPGTPRFSEIHVPPEYLAEAQEMVRVLDALPGVDPALDWVFVSPAMVYGSYVPGTAQGWYRLGGEIALPGADGGPSALSGPDFARALVDLAEGSARGHVSVAG